MLDVDSRIGGHSPTRLFHLPAALIPLLLEGDSEEVPPQVKVGADPQESLAQGDECRHVLDPVGIEMLQFDLVVMQQPLKKSVGGGRDPMLMEVGE